MDEQTKLQRSEASDSPTGDHLETTALHLEQVVDMLTAHGATSRRALRLHVMAKVLRSDGATPARRRACHDWAALTSAGLLADRAREQLLLCHDNGPLDELALRLLDGIDGRLLRISADLEAGATA